MCRGVACVLDRLGLVVVLESRDSNRVMSLDTAIRKLEIVGRNEDGEGFGK